MRPHMYVQCVQYVPVVASIKIKSVNSPPAWKPHPIPKMNKKYFYSQLYE